MKTKTDKLFLNLLDNHFSPHNKLHRFFNRTNVKINYSCIPNMNSYTYMHNHKVLDHKPNETEINNCNCRNKDISPLTNSCQTECIIYQANIAGYKQKCYFGSCETTFKDRTLNIKMILNYQNKFGKSKSAMDHQKLHGKLSEYVVLTIHTISAAFYV